MNNNIKEKAKWIWFFVLVGVGILAIPVAMKLKKPPERLVVDEVAVAVRVAEAVAVNIQAHASGYGRVTPGQTWDGVADVSGQVVYLSEQLKQGQMVKAGTELLRIDESRYKLALAQIDAQLNASLVTDQSTRQSIKSADEEQRLVQAEFDRQQALVSQGSVSRSAVDATQRTLLNVQSSLRSLENMLNISSAEREVLKVQREQAELDLQNCLFRAPMDVRITEVLINRSQQVNRGQTLFSADGIATAEITAQFPIGKLRPLVGGQPALSNSTDMPWVPGIAGVDAKVWLRSGDHQVSWSAKIERVAGSVTAETQTLGVVATVEHPYEQAQAGQRPPLIRNMFVELELIGTEQSGRVVIPAAALHQGMVYLINDENRLEIRQIKIGWRQQDVIVVADGLQAGDRIILSDLIPAVDGMLLKPMKNQQLTEPPLVKEGKGSEPDGALTL